MKKFILITTTLAFVLVIFCIVTSIATAATVEEINTAIDKGLAWLASVQDPDSGAWHYMDDRTTDLYTDITTTALVVLKFVDRAKENGLDPFDTNQESPTYYKYASNVIAGYYFIFNNAIAENDRIYFTYKTTTYSTGAAMMAIAASNAPNMVITNTWPLYGKTYQQALQEMMNWMEFAQQKGMNHECDKGGWDNSDDADDVNRWADQTNSGYASLGIGFSLAPPPAGFGLLISDDVLISDNVLTRLSTYIDSVQDPIIEGVQDPYDGGSWYEPCTPYKWINILNTGTLLYEMALVGDTVDSKRVQNAISYIQNHWNDKGRQPDAEKDYTFTSLGWKDSYQAMFMMMKGLEKFGIGTLNIDGSNIDWFDEVSDVIVNNQIVNNEIEKIGSFARLNPDIYEGEESTTLRTAFALLTLEGDIPQEAKPVSEMTKTVPVDIKPYSCPNPLYVRDKGLLYVAILGTEDFDVTQIDPASIRLEGVAPLRWTLKHRTLKCGTLKDVATPFKKSTGKEHCYEDCTTKGPDGFMDLRLKFRAQKVVVALGDVTNNECRVLKLTGNLKEEYGGTAIEGEDVVVIQKKHNKGKCWCPLKREWLHYHR